MNSIDIILGLLLVLSFVSGYKKGFLLSLASLIGLILGLLVAYYSWEIMGGVLLSWFDWSPVTTKWIAFLITFLIVAIAVNMAGRILTKIINFVALGFINKILGGAFSVIKYAFLVSVIFLFLDNSGFYGYAISEEKKEESKLYAPIASLAPMVLPGLMKTYEEIIEDDETEIDRVPIENQDN